MADTKISALSEATSLIDADLVPVVTDVATVPVTKYSLWSTVVTYIVSALHAATGKTTPVDNDEFLLIDSAASYVKKVLTWANIKATLASTFASLTGATFTGTIFMSNARSTASPGNISLLDDTAISFTPSLNAGLIVFYNLAANEYALVAYNTVTPATFGHVLGSAVVVTTGVLTDGTSDGTDGKMNISCHTDGKIYIKNRMGGTRGIRYTLL